MNGPKGGWDITFVVKLPSSGVFFYVHSQQRRCAERQHPRKVVAVSLGDEDCCKAIYVRNRMSYSIAYQSHLIHSVR